MEAGVVKQDTDAGKVTEVAEDVQSFVSIITADGDAFLGSSSQTEDKNLLVVEDHLELLLIPWNR